MKFFYAILGAMLIGSGFWTSNVVLISILWLLGGALIACAGRKAWIDFGSWD